METIKRIGLILLAALLLTALSLPLANTQWAEGMRSNTAEGEMEGEGRGDMSGVLIAVVSFVKTLVFMGIPFGITLLVIRVTKQTAR